jgi:lysophospholipase L1-like esterase
MHTDTASDTATEMTDPYCLGPGEADGLLGDAPWRRLLVMGDSVAAGLGDPVPGYEDRSWADRLAAILAPAGTPTAYLNLGHIGARAAEIRAAQLTRALAFGPDLAVVAAGGNDALRRSFSPAAVEAELTRIISPLHARGALVVTLGCLDVSRTDFLPPERRAGLRERLDELGLLTERVTRRHGGVHVDLLQHPAQVDDLFSADRLHPDRRGHAIIATEVIRSLARHRAGVARLAG